MLNKTIAVLLWWLLWLSAAVSWAQLCACLAQSAASGEGQTWACCDASAAGARPRHIAHGQQIAYRNLTIILQVIETFTVFNSCPNRLYMVFN
jgi:hypothetical protein